MSETRTRIADILSREEIRSLTQRCDWHGAWAVFSTWGVLALTFTALAWAQQHLPLWAFALALPVGLAVIAGRQLCLAILQHDAAHGTLFKSKW